MNKIQRVISFILSTAIFGSFSAIFPVSEAAAEDLLTVSFTAEVYTEDTHKNYQVPMHYEFDIDIQGDVVVSIYSDEHFTADNISTNWKVEMPIIKLTTEQITMSRDYMFYASSDKSTSSFKQYNNMNCSGRMSNCYGELSQGHSVLTLYGALDSNNKTKPLKMSSGLVSKAQIFHVQSTIYTDTDGRFFIKDYDGNKNYFLDTITIDCNGVTITKAIGSDAEGQAPDLIETDEAKIARLESEKAKLQKDLETKQNQVSSLSDQLNAIQAQLYETQINADKQAGDINKDGFTNASDAAVILIYAAYVGAGGTLDLPEWLNSPYRWSSGV